MRHLSENSYRQGAEAPGSHPGDQVVLRRTISFALICLLAIAAFWRPLVALFHLALQNDYCTHILLVPLVSIFLIYLHRERIFLRFASSYLWGVLSTCAGGILYFAALPGIHSSSSGNALSLVIASFVLVVFATFLFCFGAAAFRQAIFPLFFLLLMIPPPPTVLDRLIDLLQSGSTAIAYDLFRILSVPVLRDHFVLALPDFSIQVAKECSSIRSSLALFIAALLAAHLYLRKPWTKILLVAIAIPLSVFKNAVRIVTLCMLATRVNPGFLDGRLHHDGGVVFYCFALLILALALHALRRAEKLDSPRALPVAHPHANTPANCQ